MARELRFGDWHFCPDTGVLDRDGTSVALEPRVARLLEYFLDNPGELLSHDQLVEVVWKRRVVSDDAIRRAVSSLRHALAADGSDKLITTVHKKGYLASLPPAVLVSIAPVLPATAGSAPRAARSVIVYSHRSALLASLVLLVAIAGAWAWLLQRPAAPPAGIDGPPYTLAVLPFVDLSEGGDNAWLADGLAEELLGLLGRFSAFRVPARSSSFQFRDQENSPREVGAALGVRYLVEGSVRRDADWVRINVHLVEADTGFQLWSENFSRGVSGLFALQADIATQVARALQVVLVEPELPAALALQSAGPAGAEAYLEYLKGRQLMASWGTDDVEVAIGHLQNAIALAPEFAPAYTKLAEAVLMQANSSNPERMRVHDTVLALLEKSTALDPQLGEAYGLRAQLRADGEEALMEQDLRQSIALSPTYTPAYELLANLLFRAGRREEALLVIDQARSLDPLWPRNHYAKAIMMLDSCDHEQAAELAREALRVNPRFRSGLVMLGGIAGWRGEFVEAVRLLEEALALDLRADWVKGRLQMAYLDLGDLAAAREVAGDSFASRWRELHYLGDHAAAGEMIYGVDPAKIEGSLSLWSQTNSVLTAAMVSGDYARARRYFGKRFNYEGGLPQEIAPSDRYHLLHLVLAWYGPGHDAEARALISRLWTELNATPQAARGCMSGYQALSHALAGVSLGHYDEAISVLEDAIAKGGIFAGWHWIIANHPGFAALLQEPRLQQLLRQRQTLVEEQREILARMRAEGVVPLRGATELGAAERAG